MRTINIYKAERDAGLSEQISKGCNIAYSSEVIKIDDDSWQNTLLKQKIKENVDSAIAKIDDVDLYPLSTILVSNGWNKNDDVFLAEELFAARHTPEDKPFNFEHNESDIIGHMVANSLVDTNYKKLDNDLLVDELPNPFHILTHAVLYKRWSNAELQERMNKIIAELDQNKWFVSMECLFSNFDYAIKTSAGEQKIVARDSSTAFMTKHLRVYGGNGVYQDSQIGRILRNIVFCGKGLVANPANPNSIIFANMSNFNPEIISGQAAPVENLDDTQARGTDMSDVKSVELLQEQNADHKKLIDKLQEQLADAQKQLANTNTESLNKQIESLTSALEQKDKDLDTLKTELDSTNAEKSELSAKIEESEKQIQDFQSKFDKLEAEARKTKRMALLESAGKTADESKALYDKFGSLDDEMFNSFVDTIKVAVTAKASEQVESTDKVDNEVLDNAEADNDKVDLVVDEDNVDDEVKAKRLALQKFIAKSCLKQSVSEDQSE